MKDKLVFDVTDVDTIADSDSVGAYLRASDGTLLTHSDVGGKKALDVSIADGVNVEVDLSHIDDSVRLGDGTDFFTSTSENGDIALDVHISNTDIAINDGGNSITVDAVDLDIRDLAFATDKVDVTGSEVSLDAATLAALETITVEQGTSPWVIGDGGGSITVDAIDLDIRDLTAASDSVQSNMFDGAGTALTSTLVGADQALDINVVQSVDPATSNTAILSAADTLAAAGTAEKVVAANLADRKVLYVRNNDNRVMYVGASGVTAANGFPVSPGSYLELKAGASVDVYYNSAKAGHAIRTLELS